MADLGFVSGMFVQPSLSSGFAGERVAGSRQSNVSSTVTMRVDAFQRQYQSFGKVMVDYTLGKRPYEYTRKGSPADLLDYPPGPEWAGVHSLTLCNKRPGISSVMAKADEFLAKAVLARDMVNNCKYGELNTYGSYCHDGQSKFEAERKRGAMRTASFKEAQKPMNVRLNQIYSSRKAAFASTGPTTWRDFYCAQGIRNKVENNLPTRNPGDSINIMKQMTPQEYLDSFKKSANYMGKSSAAMLEYPFSPAYAGIYAISSCNKNPGLKQIMSKADEHIARMRQMQANAANAPYGVYDTYGSYCHDGIAKGQAEEIRVAQRTASYRECLKDTATKKNQEFEARKAIFAASGPSTFAEIYANMPMVNKVTTSMSSADSTASSQQYYESLQMSGGEAGQALYDSYRSNGQEYFESFRSGMPVAKPTWASSGVASKPAPPAPKPAAKAPEPEESSAE
uniref:Uncharacterized protein n=2 Tax=Eukaryota TaxID=2759 RepID=A0A7S3A3G8_9RHOD|mmetsp:Transcript_4188/g.17785  ORF Transcript_4188/g.17785 Transcript_4188/m.17785 type:complete len:453 (+) Transcript_4188:146-1504(+)|eukprot:CAMPEP_0113958708 /NCGR_PEP_ID=MMETSP0011_2-20120614/3642_1 /TAXON_ID=101924 /ORGANISM="Rhodosorus marinus" /LENGTH=452 /DNA_ID=CAMNT_0000969745 /DNA_START=99 /DNA_END=1457 /DNA_ORIENTATION=- /assembly_acc=CAM_ASM_000156